MPRIQVLHLPPTPDEPAPFALVIDGLGPLSAEAGPRVAERWDEAAKRVGARGGIISSDLIDVPGPRVVVSGSSQVGEALIRSVRAAADARSSSAALATGGIVRSGRTVEMH